MYACGFLQNGQRLNSSYSQPKLFALVIVTFADMTSG